MLTQVEAEMLINELKTLIAPPVVLPNSEGGKKTYDLMSKNYSDERFQFDINRSKINVRKCTFQGRCRSSVQLIRLDINSRHTNPDGTEIKGTHLHLYLEGSMLSWAEPFDLNNPDLVACCMAFMNRFNIIETAIEFQEGMLNG